MLEGSVFIRKPGVPRGPRLIGWLFSAPWLLSELICDPIFPPKAVAAYSIASGWLPECFGLERRL